MRTSYARECWDAAGRETAPVDFGTDSASANASATQYTFGAGDGRTS
jgi:hypothetical protein